MLKNLAVFVALAVFVPDVLDFVIRALRKLISLNVVFFIENPDRREVGLVQWENPTVLTL